MCQCVVDVLSRQAGQTVPWSPGLPALRPVTSMDPSARGALLTTHTWMDIYEARGKQGPDTDTSAREKEIFPRVKWNKDLNQF